jgi:hypothetical protein
MAKTQLCSSCRMPTRMLSPISPGRPLCQHCQPGTHRSPTLDSMARRPAPPRIRQCEHCLAVEVITKVGPMQISNLRDGTCKDKLACEARQPPLIPREEL